MKFKLKAAALILTAALSLAAFLGGCSEIGEIINTAVDSASEVLLSQSETTATPEKDVSDISDNDITGSPSAQSEKTYTMADVKKLKNTENFAKNTLEHIFDGTINSKGKATGYHYTMITDSKGELIDGTRSETDGNGVFTGKVKVSGVKKNGFSSFYPESWSPQQVVDAINTAYEDALSNPDNPRGSLWIGFCGDLEIDMYLNGSKDNNGVPDL